MDEKLKERYDRHLRIIGEEGQKILQSKKIVQVGVGGLGSPLLNYLVAIGVGQITIVDHDVVSLSNLNRQILYGADDIGRTKVEVAKEKMRKLNENVKIISIYDTLTMENAEQICKDADYLIDASDNMKTKFLVNDIGLKYNIPFTIAGVRGFEGQIISVDPHKTACYRCVFGTTASSFEVQNNKNDNKNNSKNIGVVGQKDKNSKKKILGIIGATCGVVGSIQAAETIKGLLSRGDRLLNRLFMIDLESMRTIIIKLLQNENCICSKSKSA
ncbi:MAG: HesA/MoeB/ThiF family protein [Promethearchaeota archaeon]